MGKKKGKEKKGHGAKKTLEKTDRKAEKKLKKELQKQGEEDIEKLIAEFQEQDRKRAEIIETKCPPPSRRCNMSLVPHPDKDELVMFGGEYFNGKQTMLYNDLFFYNIKNNEWTLVKCPKAPPPRCAHQAVAISQCGGQMWIFGGEFSSPTQSQFYHYNDLWVYSFKERTWNKISASNAPSSRSGHRMVACKKLLIVFGGFHDNIRDYKYFNDIHAFSLENYTWLKLDITGIPPSPRSGCILAVSQDQNHITVYGGYSKERIKKDVDKGNTHTDMFRFSVESRYKRESVPFQWKWLCVRQSGCQPSPRCGSTGVAIPGNKAIMFGGVFDEIEDEETVEGVFYNDLFTLELDKAKWHEVILKGKKDVIQKKKRRKKKLNEESSPGDEGDEEMMDEQFEELRVDDDHDEDDDITEAVSSPGMSVQNDGVFTVTVAPSRAPPSGASDEVHMTEEQSEATTAPLMPGVRMNAALAIKHGTLYLYGGLFEVGDKMYTLSDMYTLDIHKLDTWVNIIPSDLDEMEWQQSEESSSEEDMESEHEEKEDSEEEDEDEEEEMDTAPSVGAEETLDDYYQRTTDYWLRQATCVAKEEGISVSDKQLKKAAGRMAKDFYKEHQDS